MACYIRKILAGLLLVGTIVLGLALGLGMLNPAGAAAAIQQLEEAPGQWVYQSRQTLKDQHGNAWQTIAFKRIRPDGQTSFELRLVGFPGVVDIDRSQPLTLTNSLGQILTAPDDSSHLFIDSEQPASNVGQYDLQPLLSELRAELPLQLSLPTVQGEAVRLSVSPLLVEEWHTVAQQS